MIPLSSSCRARGHRKQIGALGVLALASSWFNLHLARPFALLVTGCLSIIPSTPLRNLSSTPVVALFAPPHPSTTISPPTPFSLSLSLSLSRSRSLSVSRVCRSDRASRPAHPFLLFYPFPFPPPFFSFFSFSFFLLSVFFACCLFRARENCAKCTARVQGRRGGEEQEEGLGEGRAERERRNAENCCKAMGKVRWQAGRKEREEGRRVAREEERKMAFSTMATATERANGLSIGSNDHDFNCVLCSAPSCNFRRPPVVYVSAAM